MSDSQETTLQTPVFEVATLAGGCFWCLEAVFDELRGVSDVRPHDTPLSLCSILAQAVLRSNRPLTSLQHGLISYTSTEKAAVLVCGD